MSSFTQCIARTAIGLAALSAACSVQAFADDDARRAILELRESIKTLQADLEANRNAQIQLSTEINNLKELNRRLTVRIEELVNAQNQEKRNARTQYETLDKRLAVFEPQVVVIDGQSIEVSAEEKKAYDTAVALLQTGKYGDAEKAFKDFNDNFKKSPYRMDALFWWGTSAFANEHYKTAISSQNQLLREFSKGARAADAMMLVASSQAASGSINAAKATLQKIIKTYPKTDVAKEAAQRIREFDQKK